MYHILTLNVITVSSFEHVKGYSCRSYLGLPTAWSISNGTDFHNNISARVSIPVINNLQSLQIYFGSKVYFVSWLVIIMDNVLMWEEYMRTNNLWSGVFSRGKEEEEKERTKYAWHIYFVSRQTAPNINKLNCLSSVR